MPPEVGLLRSRGFLPRNNPRAQKLHSRLVAKFGKAKLSVLAHKLGRADFHIRSERAPRCREVRRRSLVALGGVPASPSPNRLLHHQSEFMELGASSGATVGSARRFRGLKRERLSKGCLAGARCGLEVPIGAHFEREGTFFAIRLCCARIRQAKLEASIKRGERSIATGKPKRARSRFCGRSGALGRRS